MNRNEQNFQNPVQVKLKLFTKSNQYQQKKTSKPELFPQNLFRIQNQYIGLNRNWQAQPCKQYH